MKAVCVAILFLMLSGSLFAQSADRNKLSSEPLFATAVMAPSTAKAAPVKAEKVFDKKFFAAMASLGGAESFRFTSRKLVVEHEFAAGAPWINSVPSDSSVVGKHLGLFSAEFAAAYEWKKPHSWLPGDRVIRKLWWAYPAAMTVIHVKNAVGNVRTQGPGGCTSIACAEQMQ